MADSSIECILGRMQQNIENIYSDIKEIKEEQKRVSEFVTTQKAGYWFLTTIVAAIGTVLIGFHEEVSRFLGFTKIPN